MNTLPSYRKSFWTIAVILLIASIALFMMALIVEPVSAQSTGPNKICDETWTLYGYEISCTPDARCQTPPKIYAEIFLWKHVDTFCNTTIVRKFNSCVSSCQAAPQP